MNSSSKLEFPSVFASQERKVLLEGEAFFAVKKNPDKAFIVVARNRNISQEVLVYGTTFNVNAYAETKAIVTTLVEGSVKVRAKDKEVLLRSSQQSVMGQDSIMVSPANIDMNLSWRNNLFYFAETAIQYVMSQISRWYDVDIVYDSEMPELKLTGITLPCLQNWPITGLQMWQRISIKPAYLLSLLHRRFCSTRWEASCMVMTTIWCHPFFYELVKSFYRFVRFFTFS